MGRTKGTGVATGKPADLDELEALNALYEEMTGLEAENREAGGLNYSYLKLLGNSANDPIMKKGKAEYIEGAKEGHWVIPSKKLYLGEEVKLTVLGMFSLFEDSIAGQKSDSKSKQEPMRQIVGYWMPKDAEHIPVEGIFDRPYVDKNGETHILKPVHWVFVHLHDHPEIDDALITFKSKGNAVYKELQRLFSSVASTTELCLMMTNQELTAKGYDRDYLYPKFEVVSRNYEVVDGKIKLIRGAFSAAEVAEVIRRGHALQSDYAGHKMVRKKTSIAAIVAGAGDSGKSTALTVVNEADENLPARF